MPKIDNLIETFKEWVAASNPGLVTREDLAELEQRIDTMSALLDELEKRGQEPLSRAQTSSRKGD